MVSNVCLLRGVQECDPGAREATRETGQHAHFKKEPTSATEDAEVGRSSRPLTLYLQATDPIAITSIYDNPSTADLLGCRAPAMRTADAPLNHIAGVLVRIVAVPVAIRVRAVPIAIGVRGVPIAVRIIVGVVVVIAIRIIGAVRVAIAVTVSVPEAAITKPATTKFATTKSPAPETATPAPETAAITEAAGHAAVEA